MSKIEWFNNRIFICKKIEFLSESTLKQVLKIISFDTNIP